MISDSYGQFLLGIEALLLFNAYPLPGSRAIVRSRLSVRLSDRLVEQIEKYNTKSIC